MSEALSPSLADALASAHDTRSIIAGADVIGRAGALYRDLFGKSNTFPPAQLVADENTWMVAGEAVRASLQEADIQLDEPLIFPAAPSVYASYENVERVREHLKDTPGIAVVVGSGTLNDLVKLASGELERPYLVVATAASMDGYAAYGASITKSGFKNTIYCPAPAGILADHVILAQAPHRMTASGMGDLAEKLTGGADWIIADALGVDPIDAQIWHTVQDPLRPTIASAASLADGGVAAVSQLAEGLLMSGLAMQAHMSSRPASGAGHQFSHLWEMEGLGAHDEPPLSHGLKVGLGTIAMSALYEVALRRDLDALDIDAAVAAWPTWEQMQERVHQGTFSPDLAEAALQQTQAKYVTADVLRDRLTRLTRLWPSLRRVLTDQILPAAEVEQRLKSVGAVTHPQQIGLDLPRFRATYTRAQMIRSRYTVLDLLLETGLLQECVSELFAPGGFWDSRPWTDGAEPTQP